MAVVVGIGSPDLEVDGRGNFETVYGRGEGVVNVGIDSWMPLVVRHSLEKCFSNAKNVVY
jgi:hypothetical protein